MGYTSRQYLSQDCSTLANFIQWGSAASAALSSSGWIQTGDTGQVNWGTIAALPALGSTVYEIWHPNDALQTGATAYFLKVYYGRAGAGSPYYGGQVGFATDGAGNFVGNFAAGIGLGSFSNISNVYECNFCGDVNRFCVSMWRNGNFPYFWGVERTIDPTGADSSEGVVLLGQNSYIQVLCFTQQTASPNYGYFSMGTSVGTSDHQFNNLVPVVGPTPTFGVEGNPTLNFVSTPATNLVTGSEFDVRRYGSTRHYYTIGPNNGSFGFDAGLGIAMRYD